MNKNNYFPMVKTIDYTAELYEFSAKYKIELVGEYTNVKKTTPIYFKCAHCEIRVKKSYGTLAKYKDHDNVCIWKNICSKCFKRAMY